MLPASQMALVVSMLVLGICLMPIGFMRIEGLIVIAVVGMIFALNVDISAAANHASHASIILGWVVAIFMVVTLAFAIADAVDHRKSERKSDQRIVRLDRDHEADNGKDPIALWREPKVVSDNDLKARALVTIYGEIDDIGAETFFEQSDKVLVEDKQQVLVKIATTGGDDDVALQMFEQLLLLVGRTATDICGLVVGTCYAEGIYPFMALPRENRWATSGSKFMIDGAKLTDELITMLASDTHIDVKTLKALAAAKQQYRFDASTALHLGLISAVH